MKARIQELHERGTRVAKAHVASERELVLILREMEELKGYLGYGATSLYDYAHRILGLEEHTAYTIINVARKSLEVPELAAAVANGDVTVSKARRIVSVITSENKDAWLDLAKTSTKSEIERAVKIECPEPEVRESLRFVAEDRLELKCGLDEEGHDKMKRIMELEAQRTGRHVNQEAALVAAFDAYLAKHDPLLKAEKARDREIIREAKQMLAEHRQQLGPGQVRKSQSKRRSRVPIAAALKHRLNLRDQARCTFVDHQGRRCRSQRWLEFHHRVPVAAGGGNSLENLVTLCSAHHGFAHS